MHIATEGPLGYAARRYAKKRGLPFTTSYHTRFPEYLSARFPLPLSWGYAVMRRFHSPSSSVMVATPSLRADLEARGFSNLKSWTRGVDTNLFKPERASPGNLPRPRFLYVGRVAVEKNIEAFLKLDLPGSKIVVGGGPQLPDLAKRFPSCHFTGPKERQELAEAFASADVFVFPSRTDTFGLVILEALASGLPVAAYPVTGPKDIIADGEVGILSEDLRQAALGALPLSRARCRAHALTYSWRRTAEIFLENLAPIKRAA